MRFPLPLVGAHRYPDGVLSRRQLLIAAGALPAAGVLLDTEAADAQPIVLSDNRARTYGPIMQIGDSTSGGYISGLNRTLKAKKVGPFRCDIQGARSIDRPSKRFPSAITAVRNARARGFDPPAYLLALGSNDLWVVRRKKDAAPKMIDKIMEEIGEDRTVGFLTLYTVHRSSAPKFNRALRDATKRWPNLYIMDWAAVAKQHKEWHNKGGVHYTMRGAIQRNRYMADAMIRTVRIAEASGSTTTTTTTTSSTTVASSSSTTAATTTTTTLSPG